MQRFRIDSAGWSRVASCRARAAPFSRYNHHTRVTASRTKPNKPSKQADDIGTQYALTTGYNSWAAENDLVVLYPQARRTALNPKGCFDW